MSEECIATLEHRRLALSVGGRKLGEVVETYYVWGNPDKLLRKCGYVRVSEWECVGPDRYWSGIGDSWSATVEKIGEDDE